MKSAQDGHADKCSVIDNRSRFKISISGCPDAILCLNDDVAMQTYRALMDVGCRIPQDALLVGCDGLPVTAYFEPPLSTIVQPFAALSAAAWEFLQARMAQPNLLPQYACFDAKLVVRRSLRA